MSDNKDSIRDPEKWARDKLREQADAIEAEADHVRATGQGGTRAEVQSRMKMAATATATTHTRTGTTKGTGKREPWEVTGPAYADLSASHPKMAERARELAKANATKGITVEAVAAAMLDSLKDGLKDGARQEYETRTVPFANMLRATFGRKSDRDRGWKLWEEGADAEAFSRAALTPDEIAAIDAAGMTAVEALAKVGKLEPTDHEAAEFMGMSVVVYAIHYNQKGAN